MSVENDESSGSVFLLSSVWFISSILLMAKQSIKSTTWKFSVAYDYVVARDCCGRMVIGSSIATIISPIWHILFTTFWPNIKFYSSSRCPTPARAPYDFWLFLRLKMSERFNIWSQRGNKNQWVVIWKNYLQKCFGHWKDHWDKCVKSEGSI